MSTVVLPITKLETSETPPPPDYKYSVENDESFADLASTEDIECALAKLQAERDREQQERPSSILDIASTAMRMPTIAADAAMSLSTSSILAPAGKADAASIAMRRPTITDVAMSVVKTPVSVAVGTGNALQDVALNVSKTGASVAGMLGSVVHRASIVMAPPAENTTSTTTGRAEALVTMDVPNKSASLKERETDVKESLAEEFPSPDAGEGKQNDGRADKSFEVPEKDAEESCDDSTSKVTSTSSQHHLHEHQEKNRRQRDRLSKTLSKQNTNQRPSRSLSPPPKNLNDTCSSKEPKTGSLNGSRSLTPPPMLKRYSTTDKAKIKASDYYDWARRAGCVEKEDCDHGGLPTVSLLIDDDPQEKKEMKIHLQNTSESALTNPRHKKDVIRRPQSKRQHSDQTLLKAKRDLSPLRNSTGSSGNPARKYLDRTGSADVPIGNRFTGSLHPSNFTGSGSKRTSSLGSKQKTPLEPSSGSRHVRRATMRRATSLQEVPEDRSKSLQPLTGIHSGALKENANHDWTASQGMLTKKKGREGRLGKPVCRIGRCQSESDGQKRTKHRSPNRGDPCKMRLHKAVSESQGIGSGTEAQSNDDIPVRSADIANLVDLVKSLQKEVVALRQEVKELKSDRELSGSGGSTSSRRKQKSEMNISGSGRSTSHSRRHKSEMDTSGSGRSTSHRRKNHHIKVKPSLAEHDVSGHNLSAHSFAFIEKDDSIVEEEDDINSVGEFHSR